MVAGSVSGVPSSTATLPEKKRDLKVGFVVGRLGLVVLGIVGVLAEPLGRPPPGRVWATRPRLRIRQGKTPTRVLHFMTDLRISKDYTPRFRGGFDKERINDHRSSVGELQA